MSKKPTVAIILALMGGIIVQVTGVLVGVIVLVVGVFSNAPPWLSLSWGLLGILIGIPIMIGALMMYADPDNHTKWGILVIVSSLVSWDTPSGGGFLIGWILGLSGGILGVAWKPPSTSPQSLQSKRCQNCGKLMDSDAKYCSNCGKAFL